MSFETGYQYWAPSCAGVKLVIIKVGVDPVSTLAEAGWLNIMLNSKQ